MECVDEPKEQEFSFEEKVKKDLNFPNINDKKVVCTYWLDGLCQNGYNCQFVHELYVDKMPFCKFMQQNNNCSDPTCPFRHNVVHLECCWFKSGMCLDRDCKCGHNPKKVCPNYLLGFCPDGPNCKFAHPDAKPTVEQTTILDMIKKMNNGIHADLPEYIVCFSCRQLGHKSTECPFKTGNLVEANNSKIMKKSKTIPKEGDPDYIKGVTCNKCGQKGHYANTCPIKVAGRGRGRGRGFNPFMPAYMPMGGK